MVCCEILIKKCVSIAIVPYRPQSWPNIALISVDHGNNLISSNIADQSD